MHKFQSKVVRVDERGGKFVVELKEKVFDTGVEAPVVDDSTVKIYDTAAQAQAAISEFYG